MVENSLTDQILNAVLAMSAWELLAVLLALAYLILAMKERIECWYAAFISTSIYTFLFWDVDLLMEFALQIYYLVMAVYGWRQWRKHSNTADSAGLEITLWSPKQHIFAFFSIGLLVFLSGYLLQKNTTAAMPYLDSFTTWGAVVTTYMVARKVLENWIYWLVIDGVSIYLYIDRGLYLTALLFALYIVIVVFGFFHWRKMYQQQNSISAV